MLSVLVLVLSPFLGSSAPVAAQTTTITLDVTVHCDTFDYTLNWEVLPDDAYVFLIVSRDMDYEITILDGTVPVADNGSHSSNYGFDQFPGEGLDGWSFGARIESPLGTVLDTYTLEGEYDRDCSDPATPDPVTPEDDTPVTLPSTGVGQSSSPTSLYILVTGALMVVVAAGLTLRRSREER